MKKYLSKESLKGYKDFYKKKGLKALLKKLGWRVFVLVFVFYLIRDVVLYVIGPKVFLEFLASFGISSDVSYPFFGFVVIFLIVFWVYRSNKQLKIKIFRVASFFGALCIILGAFGSHLLQDTLESLDNKSTYSIAFTYHFFHTFLMITLGLLIHASNLKNIKRSFVFCVLGIFLFSGSLYLLSVTNIKWLGSLTPIGGFCFILSWFFLFLSFPDKK
jgi:uncharacterized membrane protein YgdD (TMEM256/DUF423 family)